MDASEIKRNIKNTFKKISNKNHPSVIEKLTKNYYSLNDAVTDYDIFLKKLRKLKSVDTWGNKLLEFEGYESANLILEKIKNDLQKGFKVVPYDLVDININSKTDEVFISYTDYNKSYNEFKIANFSKRISNGFKYDEFNNLSKPLDFGKILEYILNDINGYWIKNIIKYMKTINKIEETNIKIEEINNKISSENEVKKDKVNSELIILDELNVIFPIKLENGELFVPNKLDDTDDYTIVDSNGHGIIKILHSHKFDKSITSILFDKCKIDRKSIPSWVKNSKLFNSMDSVNKDFKSIKNEFEQFKNKYKNIYPYKVVYTNNNNIVTENKIEDVKPTNEKKEKPIINSDVNIEEVKNKVFKVLVKTNGKVTKKIDIPDQILFSLNSEGIKEIDKRFQPYLSCLNLANIKFDNVDVSGVDFSNTNPRLLNPQTIYNKDLSCTKFNSFPFFKTVSFDEVDLSDAIIIVNDDIDVNFSGAFGNINTYININNKDISIRIKKQK